MKIISRADARTQGIKYFFTGKPCRVGHIDLRYVSSGSCKECEKLKLRERYRDNPEKYRKQASLYYQENRKAVLEREKRRRDRDGDRINARRKQLRPQRKERTREANRIYREKNRGRLIQQKRRHYRENRDRYAELSRQWKTNNPDWSRENRLKRCDEDPTYPIIRTVRDMVRRCLKGTGKSATEYAKYLGYTKEDLVIHLERQFTKGMSWDNYGEWHIDHITPVAWFARRGITDPVQINCLTNLRPTWASENQRKGDKQTYLL